MAVPPLAAGFIDFIIKPAFEAWFALLKDSTIAVEGMANLDANRKSWMELKEAEDRQKRQAEAEAGAEPRLPAEVAPPPATSTQEAEKVEQVAKEEAVA